MYILIGIVFIKNNSCINKDAKGQFIRKKNMKNNPCSPLYLYNFFSFKTSTIFNSKRNDEIIYLRMMCVFFILFWFCFCVCHYCLK